MFSSIARRFSNKQQPKQKKDKGSGMKAFRRDMKALNDANSELLGLTGELQKELFKTKKNVDSVMNNGVDRTLYSMPMPENVDAMTDLIKLHKDGDKFPYVGIVGNEGEDPDSRRARLLAIKPGYGARHIPEIVVEACPLINTEGEFSMQDLMEYAKSNSAPVQPQSGPMPKLKNMNDYVITKKYLHVKSITAMYTPNMSSTSDYCGFHIVLDDTRMINREKCGQSNSIVSNQEGVMEMSCDYCVGVADLAAFSLKYQLEREIVHPGFQWGTLTFYFNITESDIPFQSTKKTALAVYRMPLTTLVDRETDADKSNIIFTPEDVKALREMFMKGDIVDVDQPQEARLKKSSYSKSTLRSAPKGEAMTTPAANGWEMMQGARKPKIDAMVASVSAPSEDGGEDPYADSKVEEVKLLAKKNWEEEQERMRREMEDSKRPLSQSSSLPRYESPPRNKGILKLTPEKTIGNLNLSNFIDESEDTNGESNGSKSTRFANNAGINPDLRDVHPF